MRSALTAAQCLARELAERRALIEASPHDDSMEYEDGEDDYLHDEADADGEEDFEPYDVATGSVSQQRW